MNGTLYHFNYELKNDCDLCYKFIGTKLKTNIDIDIKETNSDLHLGVLRPVLENIFNTSLVEIPMVDIYRTGSLKEDAQVKYTIPKNSEIEIIKVIKSFTFNINTKYFECNYILIGKYSDYDDKLYHYTHDYMLCYSEFDHDDLLYYLEIEQLKYNIKELKEKEKYMFNEGKNILNQLPYVDKYKLYEFFSDEK